jgi:hypothetical protein
MHARPVVRRTLPVPLFEFLSTNTVLELYLTTNHELFVSSSVEASWNVMAHAQTPDFVYRQNRRVHLNRRGRQFNRLLAAEMCASAVVMLDTPCSEVVWSVLATHSIRQFPLHLPARASPCAFTFQLESTILGWYWTEQVASFHVFHYTKVFHFT